MGNEPTKRLLLTSNSYINVSFDKLFGITPQNLLELISGGKYPAISAWFRSIPATTIMLWSSSAGAQNTPL
ncbi:hypothetical protein N665_1170s0007 [Sinapis alba]|nr:hypothetical protein N665_1170s0007 [Sinapis alba]